MKEIKLDRIPPNIDIFGSRRAIDNPKEHKDKKFLVLVYASYYRGAPEDEYLAIFDGINTFSKLDYNLEDIKLRSKYPTFVGQEKFQKGV